PAPRRRTCSSPRPRGRAAGLRGRSPRASRSRPARTRRAWLGGRRTRWRTGRPRRLAATRAGQRRCGLRPGFSASPLVPSSVPRRRNPLAGAAEFMRPVKEQLYRTAKTLAILRSSRLAQQATDRRVGRRRAERGDPAARIGLQRRAEFEAHAVLLAPAGGAGDRLRVRQVDGEARAGSDVPQPLPQRAVARDVADRAVEALPVLLEHDLAQ